MFAVHLRSWAHAHATLIAALFGILVAVALLTAAELTFRALASEPGPVSSMRMRYEPPPFAATSIYGVEFLPNVHTRNIKGIGLKKLWEVEYEADEFGRRKTPVDNRQSRTRFAIFFGCSFTIGEGVADNETLPARFAHYASEYMPYNYGFFGYGPQQMLLRLQTGQLAREIEETGGIGVYTLIDDHIRRATGSMRVFEGWARKFPYFDYVGGRLMYCGCFDTGRPIRSRIYDCLAEEGVFDYYQLDWPLGIRERDLRLTADIIASSSNLFKKTFPGSEFCVIFYPRTPWQYQEELEKLLEKQGVNCLDYHDLFENVPIELVEYPDTHPRASAYERVARRLAKDVETGSGGAKNPL